MEVKKIWSMSLIKRMLVLYLVGPLLLIAVFCIFITWFVNWEMNEELQLSVDSDLMWTVHTIDETVSTLTMIAEQMSYGYVSKNLSSMLEETNPYEKSQLIKNITNEINVISFTNLGIRLIGYYDRQEEKFVFVSNGTADINDLPKNISLFNKSEFYFQGPHISFARNYNELVISVQKAVPSAEGIDAYAELVVDLKPVNSFLQDVEFVIVGDKGNIICSGIEDAQKLLSQEKMKGKVEGYYYTGAVGEGGYRVYILVPEKEYFQMARKMMPAVFLAIITMGALFSGMMVLMLKNIVKPLRIFEKEILAIQNGDLEIHVYERTGIPEYDRLLDEVMIMKQKITELLLQQELAQRNQTRIRVEQLMYKINPHFLMNALDTIHWLAVEKNTEEIDKVARALNKLLYYNLKVDKNIVCLKEELQAVEQYVLLQQSRFDFRYEVDVKEEKAYKAKLPRFILQPIVENAIYHGMHENGHLVIMADVVEKLDIYIKNDGEAMEPEMLANLREEVKRNQENSQLGIGLNYVIQILRERYGQEAQIEVLGIKGEGTVIHISIPFNL